MTTAFLAAACPCLACVSLTQARFRPVAAAPPGSAHHAQQPACGHREAGAPRNGHAGDWLRRYKDVAAGRNKNAGLQNDPAFRRLATAIGSNNSDSGCSNFSDLPPQQQLRMLNRMDTWEHLTPASRSKRRGQIYGQIRQLPPDRQRMVNTAVRNLRLDATRHSAKRSSTQIDSRACSPIRSAR